MLLSGMETGNRNESSSKRTFASPMGMQETIMAEQDGPSGSYTDKDGKVHELTTIDGDPHITFDVDNDVTNMNNETAYTLVSVTFDGWRAPNVSMSLYQDIIDFCQKQIKKIPHWEVSDGEAEWVSKED